MTFILTVDAAPPGTVLSQQAVALEDALAALKRQNALIDAGNLGEYHGINNSCIVHVADVLAAGKPSTSPPTPSLEQVLWWHKLLNLRSKYRK
jgi:hypothetical protein